MKKILYLIIYIPFLLTACDVHELPAIPESVKFHLRLSYETNITEWNHIYDGLKVVEQEVGKTYDNKQEEGMIRYLVRAYPILDNQNTMKEYTHEFVFTKDIAQGYDHEVTLELPGGMYNIMVWSDLVEKKGDDFFYNADNFNEIILHGGYKGNTDYRDAFRGTENLTLIADFIEKKPDTLDIIMQRPLAKYEFVATDLKQFVHNQIEYLKKEAASRGEEPPTDIDTDNYTVVVYFSGYMPNAYNMNVDKPVDSTMGVLFESKLNLISDNEASLGFDYVFVNGKTSGVTVQIGLFDEKERVVALTEPINVPLSRSHHTMIRGSFLIREASGGITIKPDFDGEHNVII